MNVHALLKFDTEIADLFSLLVNLIDESTCSKWSTVLKLKSTRPSTRQEKPTLPATISAILEYKYSGAMDELH